MTELLDLPHLTVVGSPRRLGHEQGEAFRDKIENFVEQRLEALSQYLGDRGRRSGVAEFLTLGEACLAAARVWDPEGTEEHNAIAEAARVPAATLYATSNMTDVRDVLLYSAGVDSEGCTACLLPANLTERQGILAAQTWDLNPADLDYVVAIRRRPENGPESVSITCVGCLSLVGMNEHGLSVGTTNIKSKDVQIGVGYLSLIHRALSSRTASEAEQAISHARRAAAHTYWLADADSGVELECSASQVFVRRLEQGPIVRTNHCLVSHLVALEGEPATASSEKRLARATELARNGPHSPASLKKLFADRSEGVNSINRYPEDEQGTATNACIICSVEERRLWVCRGPADRGRWYEFGF